MPQEQPSGAYLVIQHGSLVGKRIELWKECTTIGRSRDSDIFLEDVTVHRKQASILFTKDGYALRDDHGSGDSLINGFSVTTQLLNSGDELQFGSTHMTFFANEGTRPFQLASSRGRELHIGKTPDPTSTTVACLQTASALGDLRTIELITNMSIGRSRECDIFLEDLTVSRHHATITEQTAGKYEIIDNHSATGTFVNSQPINHYILHEGDIIQIGNNTFTFRLTRS
jgi:pSer/pThr/pTyr-binding forkhead associated (FHA) protein